jgi:hypothetical protein
MLKFVMLVRTAWDDFFPETNPNKLNSTTYTSRQNPSGTSIYVLNCLFKSISSTSDGGALYCTSAAYFLVESSSFFSCKTSSSEGGAIYFYNSDSGQSVLYKVCGYDCCSSSGSQFAHIHVQTDASSINYVNYSSITRCVVESSSWHTLDLTNGTIYTRGYITIMDSCILENKAGRVFYATSSSYTFTISNCTVDSTSNNECLTIQSTVTKSFILALNHISTQNCHSKYDSAGTLTPIIQSPSLSKKQMHCYTGERYFLLPPQRDFVLLSSVFLFNFIHTGSLTNLNVRAATA